MVPKDGSVVVVKRRGSFLEILNSAFTFFAFLVSFLMMLSLALIDHEARNEIAPKILAILSGAATIFTFAVFLRHLTGISTIFDPGSGMLVFKRTFSKKQSIPFADILRIVPIHSKSLFSKRQAFAFVPKGDPIFGVRRFTTLFRIGSGKHLKFISEVMPRIEGMIGSGVVPAAGTLEASEAGLANYDRAGYTKEAGRYAKRYTKRLFAFALPGVIILLIGIRLMGFGDEGLTIIGTMLAIASFPFLFYVLFVSVKSIEFDRNKSVIEVRRGLLRGKVQSHPFNKVLSFEIGTFYGNFFLRNKRSLSLRIEGLKRPLQLTSATSSAVKLNSELELLASIMQKNPSESLSYLETRTG